MKSIETDISLLEDFIRGKLDQETSDLVKGRLLKEDNLKEDYQSLLVLIHGAKVTKLNKKLKMLQDLESTSQQAPKTKMLKLKKWQKWVAAASILGIITVLAIFLNRKETNTYPPEYASLFEERFNSELILHKTFRSTQQPENLSPEQRRAYEIYSIKQFKAASPLLQSLWEKKQDTLALFYWGVSEIGRGKVAHGKEILQINALNKYQPIIQSFK
ncbi:MAG: hypothetical protein ABIR66_04300 [Saprospiraceae bacterium]